MDANQNETMVDAVPVYYVRSERLAEVKKEFDRIGRRAAKLGMIGPVLVERAQYDETVVKHVTVGRDTSGGVGCPDNEIKVNVLVSRTLCTVEGASPKLADWRLLAAIEHVDGETMIHSFDASVDVSSYRGAAGICEHCNVRRSRNSTFVMRHDNGTTKQIGRNCLVDFIGSPDACRMYAAMAEMIESAMEACGSDDDEEGGYGGGGHSNQRYVLTEFLALTWAGISEFGWCSRKQADDGKRATVDRVLATLGGYAPKMQITKKPTDADVKKAEDTIAFIESSTEQSEFFENLRVICRLGSVRVKHAGLAAAMTMVYDKEISQRAERAARAPSVHVGTVGDRMVMDLILVRTRYIDSEYGVRTIAAFTDAAGNDLVWFASGQPDWLHVQADEIASGLFTAKETGDAKVGATFTVKATIKKHEDYKGRPQTSLARVQVFTPPAPKTPKPRRKKGEQNAE